MKRTYKIEGHELDPANYKEVTQNGENKNP